MARGLKRESFSSEKLPGACIRNSLACSSGGMALVIRLMTHGYVSHIGARTGTKMCAHMGACKMHQRLYHLNRACEKIKLELISIIDGPVSVHTHAIVKQLLQEQPNGTSRGSNSGLPRLIRSIARGGGRRQPTKISKISISAVRASMCIVPENLITNRL